MPYELAAAFVRGAVGSSAAEPWKAAVRFPARVNPRPSAHRHRFPSIISSSPADGAHHRRSLTVSIYKPEHASGREGFEPTDDPHSRRFLVVAPSSGEKAWRHEGEGGAYFKRSATSLRADSSLYLRSDSSLYPIKSGRSFSCRALMGTTASSGTERELPPLSRLVKISFLCLLLHKMGLLVPRFTELPPLGRLMKISLLCLLLHKMGPLVPKFTVDKETAGLKLLLLWVCLHVGFMATKGNEKLVCVVKVCDNALKIYNVLTEVVDLLSALLK